jgi:hypothetical protein
MRPLGTAAQFAWGGMGGIMPILVATVRIAIRSPLNTPIPQIGGLAIAAAIAAIILGAIASRGFQAHSILAALWHGATAPITFAFAFEINTRL